MVELSFDIKLSRYKAIEQQMDWLWERRKAETSRPIRRKLMLAIGAHAKEQQFIVETLNDRELEDFYSKL